MAGSRAKRSYLPLLVLALVALTASIVLLRLRQHSVSFSDARGAVSTGCSQVAASYRSHQTGAWLTVSGRVQRVLPDELGRFTHQRFILACPSGQTVLIVNDVSIGQRVPVRAGDLIGVRGQYVWNAQGGLVHFTHHDPQGGQGGWIYFSGRIYAAYSFRPIDVRFARV